MIPQAWVRRVDFVVLGGVALFLAAAWVFVELADDAPEGDYLAFERRILLSMREPDDLDEPIGPEWLANAALELSALGSPIVLGTVTCGACGYLLVAARRRTALYVLLATASGGALSAGLKTLFARPRPDLVPHLAEVSTLSFPSGHSLSSSVVYLTLGALLARTSARWSERVYVLGCACLLTGLIGLTRVYLGVHYPTDVLAGWSAGLAWALLSSGVALWMQRRGAMGRRGASSGRG